MKHLPFFCLLLVGFSGIFACGTKEPNAAPTEAKTTVSEIPPSLFISKPEATAGIARWDSLRTNLIALLNASDNASDTQYVAKGFHVPYSDLTRILANISDTSQLFAMLAIQYDSTQKPPAPYISIIFQAPDKTPARTVRYYDFTRPCPQLCPDTE